MALSARGVSPSRGGPMLQSGAELHATLETGRQREEERSRQVRMGIEKFRLLSSEFSAPPLGALTATEPCRWGSLRVEGS